MAQNQRKHGHHITAAFKRGASALLGLVLLLTLASNLQAQENPEVAKIRAAYQALTAAIAVCDAAPEEPCGYYVNTLQLNRQNQPWAAVGIFTSIQDFWYHSVDGEEGSTYVLRKINIETRRSGRSEHEEYLFDDSGNLMFYYFHLLGDEEFTQENRFYFAKGKLIHYLEKVGAEEKEYQKWQKADAAEVQKSAAKMKELFHNSF